MGSQIHLYCIRTEGLGVGRQPEAVYLLLQMQQGRMFVNAGSGLWVWFLAVLPGKSTGLFYLSLV